VTPLEGRCTQRSEAAEESLAGTASTIRHWLLLEHAGPWGRDALHDARIPRELGTALRRLEHRSDARVLLIRRTGGRSDGGVACFAADTTTPWLGRVQLDRIEDAAGLDPMSHDAFEAVADPLVLVCTHGRRDPCCAERGRPLAAATAAAFPEITWESSHIGGDRFAGNLVAFPHGLYFGRVEPERGPRIVSAYRQGRIMLDRFRGRSCQPMHVQAAEIEIRTSLGLDGVDDTTFEHAEATDERVRVTFGTPMGRFVVRLERVDGVPMRLTCHSEHERAPAAWRLLDLERAA
jgi:hypothetical protein